MQIASIIGASGFISHHLLSLLTEKNNLEIRVLVHRQPPQISERGNVRFVEGSLLQPETLERLLEPRCIGSASFRPTTAERSMEILKVMSEYWG